MRFPLALLLLASAACSPFAAGSGAPTPAGAEPLPPVPLEEGALAPRVQYPPADHQLHVRDSTFIFGEVGHGGASLTVNGVAVPVLPNGAWIAYLPVPPAAEPRYEIVAVLGADTARLAHPVRVPPPVPDVTDATALVVDSASVLPTHGLALPDGERVEVAVRAPFGASVALETSSGDTVALVREASESGGARWSRGMPAAALRAGGMLAITRDADTVRVPVPPVAAVADRWVELGADVAESDSDRVIVGRPIPAGTYKWFLLPGTRAHLTGRSGDFFRIALDDQLAVWTAANDATLLPDGTPPPRRVARNARVAAADEWVDVVIPVGEKPPYLVEQLPRALQLTLYGTRATTDIIRYPSTDTLVRLVRWEPVAADRVVFTVELSRAPYGFLVLWRDGALVLRVRRPPPVDRGRPLRGLTIAVDAGHPPAGSTGPTGLYEAVPALAISRELERILTARGATVLMTRTSDAPVALGERPVMARRANAHALVSIHLNALPDGVNPFLAHGTGTYFFHPQAEPLARAVQAGMVRRMGLRDLGIFYDNLALARPTWMPAVLCEGAFIMMPEQEAALRTPEFQRRYALGVADGLERYFRGLASDR
jgi:N-acetylmuramoyl-L-alanine amidase